MMERRPELTIIAGPNGAGKSRLCPLYVSTQSFDGDKLMLNLHKEHPDWPERWLSGSVASELEKQKSKALIFVDGNSDYGHIVALHITKSHIHRVEDNPPLWFKEQFELLFDNLSTSSL